MEQFSFDLDAVQLSKATVNYSEAVLLCDYYKTITSPSAEESARGAYWDSIRKRLGSSLTRDSQHNLF
jgi:hypothetical protein